MKIVALELLAQKEFDANLTQWWHDWNWYDLLQMTETLNPVPCYLSLTKRWLFFGSFNFKFLWNLWKKTMQKVLNFFIIILRLRSRRKAYKNPTSLSGVNSGLFWTISPLLRRNCSRELDTWCSWICFLTIKVS